MKLREENYHQSRFLLVNRKIPDAEVLFGNCLESRAETTLRASALPNVTFTRNIGVKIR